MTDFDVRITNLRAINSMTKYPSIPTYHALDPRNGALLDETLTFSGPVALTEKVDGTNGRIILLPDRSWLIGSREELLTARSDLVHNPALGIVDTLRDTANRLAETWNDDDGTFVTFYVEVYGGGIGGQWKQYARTKDQMSFRLFDVAVFYDWPDVVSWPPERIAAWRDGGGQDFMHELVLQAVSSGCGLPRVPMLKWVDASELPTGIDETRAWLGQHLPWTQVQIDADTSGRAEGMVVRSHDRSTIAKARFQDYDRTLKRRAGTRR